MKDLQFYIGAKAIKAKPMTRGEWLSLPRIDSNPQMSSSTDDKNDEGYLVQYENSNNPNIVGYDKYVSWSPKNVFEQSYLGSGNLSFGLAFEAMRMGLTISCPELTKCGIKGLSMTGWEDTIIAIYTDGTEKPFSPLDSLFQYKNWEATK